MEQSASRAFSARGPGEAPRERVARGTAVRPAPCRPFGRAGKLCSQWLASSIRLGSASRPEAHPARAGKADFMGNLLSATDGQDGSGGGPGTQKRENAFNNYVNRRISGPLFLGFLASRAPPAVSGGCGRRAR